MDESIFTITVTEKKTVTEKSGKEWAIIEQRTPTPAELADLRNPNLNLHIHGVNIHGYTPEIEKTVQRETKIYKQRVKVLNLDAVIKAINNLP